MNAATRAFPEWSETPPVVRARAMFRFRQLLDEHLDEIARIVTTEHGKTLDEARGSVRRGIECVEVACGAPSMLMGYGLENVAPGIDCQVMRQPIGVCAVIAPFNFPAMVPLWFLPFAVACGNTFVLKPSEQVPLSQQRIFELLEQCDLPPGVVNLVHGGREVAEAICDHPGIRAVSFVGSTTVARAVYQRATHAGKRVQALGGAKNFIVVMPDADLDRAIPTITESFYGCAGERCLAGSVLLPVGEAHAPARDRLDRDRARADASATASRPASHMGPVISARASRARAELRRSRRSPRARRSRSTAARAALPEEGYFVGPTRVRSRVADDAHRTRGDLRAGGDRLSGARSRRGLPHHRRASECQRDVDLHDERPHAREFAHRATASMVGVNIGVAAPMAYFPFGGARDSFFGDLKVHGRDAFAFYTDQKVTISRRGYDVQVDKDWEVQVEKGRDVQGDKDRDVQVDKNIDVPPCTSMIRPALR